MQPKPAIIAAAALAWRAEPEVRNPLPSAGESVANLTSRSFAMAWRVGVDPGGQSSSANARVQAPLSASK